MLYLSGNRLEHFIIAIFWRVPKALDLRESFVAPPSFSIISEIVIIVDYTIFSQDTSENYIDIFGSDM